MERENGGREPGHNCDHLRIEVIDVGQGDAVLLEGWDGTTMLVDSGPRHDHGETVRDHLDDRGIAHIDHLVATHYDADHIGGHAEIIKTLGSDRIGAVYGPTMEGVTDSESKTMDRYLETLVAAGLSVNELEEGNQFDIDGAEIAVLNPSRAIDSSDRNENCVVMQITHDEQGVLLASDVEGEAETRLTEQYSDQLATVTAAKAAHHGAINGTGVETLDHTEPDSLIISSGLNNQYTSEKNAYDAHPHDAMLKRVHDHPGEIDIYWTPVHGTTSVGIGDDGMQIRTARERQALSAADVTALKYHGRASDLDNEQLAETETIAPDDLPEETPDWATEAAIVEERFTLDPDRIDELHALEVEHGTLKKEKLRLERVYDKRLETKNILKGQRGQTDDQKRSSTKQDGEHITERDQQESQGVDRWETLDAAIATYEQRNERLRADMTELSEQVEALEERIESLEEETETAQDTERGAQIDRSKERAHANSTDAHSSSGQPENEKAKADPERERSHTKDQDFGIGL